MEVSSPTASCSSSSSFVPTTTAPIIQMREKIIEKISENRVTLIVGETGCGKSTQVPQFLLEANMGPILCTLPRRFAVVAVANWVAKARNCSVGEEVGYHIGRSKHLSERSKIIFKTAGVLLDELRDKGLNALKYKVIILDEVHERSVESDLVLVCIKQFLLKNNKLRIVLMSATADKNRYEDYFKDLGRGEKVKVLAISSSNQRALFQRKVSYLEQVAEFLGRSSDTESLASTYCLGPNPSMATANITKEVHKLICDLVVRIHETEDDIEKGILVFLPTYNDLEKQWHLLTSHGSSFKLHVLHRSIDIEQSLSAMRVWKSHRKVILATNIAESSVTIPKVAYVVDSCRSLQIGWDTTRKRDVPELVWVSKSQANQRAGRTGRTCDGHTFRLVTGSFFNELETFENPAILRLSLRQQVLHICCTESRAINDPKVLLQKAMDPPEPDVIEDALNLLVSMKALKRTNTRSRYEPTFYGRLLASFTLSFDASVLIVKFGEAGLLHDGILLGILNDEQPLPILYPFGQEHLFTEYAFSHFGGDCLGTVKIDRKEMVLMGNLGAYKFWQRVFKDKHRVEHLKRLLTFDEKKATTLMLTKVEEEWCSFHNLLQSSLHRVSEAYEDILSTIHRFRPAFMHSYNGLPTYYEPYEYEHTCLLEDQPSGDTDAVDGDDEHYANDQYYETRKCVAVPFTAPSHFQNANVAKTLLDITKEMRVLFVGSTGDDKDTYANGYGSQVYGETPICVYFVKGLCNRGNQCPFSHSFQARKPPCKFFLSLQGCRNGESCPYSHDIDLSALSLNEPQCLPEGDVARAESLLNLFPTTPDGCILLVDDTDLRFTTNIARHYPPWKIIATTCLSDTLMCDPVLRDVNILWGYHSTYQAIISRSGENPIPWSSVKCILWFPSFDSESQTLDDQKQLVKSYFDYLAIRIVAEKLYDVQVIIMMNNFKFSQLQVEKLSRENFFFLRESIPFDIASFGNLPDDVTTRKQEFTIKPISYVFELHPVYEDQFQNYAADMRKRLPDNVRAIV